MKWWRKNLPVAKEANTPKPPARAELLFALFEQRKADFEHEGLQGTWITTEYEQAISVISGNKSILWITKTWGYKTICAVDMWVWHTPRTLVFDEEFDYQLDEYTLALCHVVEQKQRTTEWLNAKQKERQEFEINRF